MIRLQPVEHVERAQVVTVADDASRPGSTPVVFGHASNEVCIAGSCGSASPSTTMKRDAPAAQLS